MAITPPYKRMFVGTPWLSGPDAGLYIDPSGDVFWAGPTFDLGGSVFNVKHPKFGAVGDGVADDGPTWNLARAEVPTNGGIVLVPPGSYLLTTAFTFASATNVLLWLLPGVVLTGSALPTPSGTNAIFDQRSGIAQFGPALTTDLGARLRARETTTSSSGTVQTARIEIQSATATTGTLIGLGGVGDISLSSGTIAAVVGLSGFLNQDTAGGTVTKLRAISGQIIQSDGTATNSTVLHAAALAVTSGTNAFGLDIEAITGAANNFAIRTMAGVVNLGDRLILRTVTTLADDATPSVALGNLFKTGGTTTITDFDDGIVGQTIKILSGHSVTITDGTNILLNGSANFVMAAGDVLVLTMYNDQVWVEDSRQVN